MSDVSIRSYFAGQAMQALLAADGRRSFAEIAREAFGLADEMIQHEKSEEDGGMWTAMFIGGPRHCETCSMESVPVVECPPGQYHRHFLGLEDVCYKLVYIWSELSAEDVVDLVMSAISQSPTPSEEGVVSLGNDKGRTRLTIDDGIRRMSVMLNKEAVALLAEGCSVCFNELEES